MPPTNSGIKWALMRALHDSMGCVRDLVVVDYLMPEVDGLETIASLTSEMRQTSQVPNYRPQLLPLLLSPLSHGRPTRHSIAAFTGLSPQWRGA